MSRTFAIHTAHGSYRLLMTRGVADRIVSTDEGYTVTLTGWTVFLNNSGHLVRTQAN
jgi:hypothetical protein